MNSPLSNLLTAPLPTVAIERWTGSDGWPVFRVFYRAALFGEDGEEHYIEAPDYDEAYKVARILRLATGWPIEYLGKVVS